MRKNLLLTVILCLFAGFAYSADEQVFVLNEGFESGAIPEGWSQEYVKSDFYGEHPWVVEPAAQAQNPAGAASGNYRAVLRNETNATIGYTTRLISPVMNLAYGEVIDPILVFSHAQQQRAGDFDQLKVYYRTSADGRWVRIDEDKFNHKIAHWTRDTIALSSQSATYQVMFEVTDNFGYGVVLDDIQVRPMPVCVEPFDFMVQSLSSSAATIAWNASFDTDSFEVALSAAPIESMSAANPANLLWYGFIADDIFQFSTTDKGLELERGTNYYLYVRAYCQGGSISDWSQFAFKTKNLTNLPIVENFTAGEGWEYKTGTVNHIANWTFGTSIKRDDAVTMEYMPFVNTNTEPNSTSAANYAYDGSFCLAFTGARALGEDIPAGQYVYCATPEINLESLKDVHVSFWGTAYQSVGDDYASGIIIGVMTDPEDFSSFVAVDTCYITSNRTFNKFDVSLASYAGEGKYVAFASDFKDKANRFYIDNISIKEIAAPAFPSDIKLSNISSNGFDLSLNSHGSQYNLIVAKRMVLTTGEIVDDPAKIEASNIFVTLNNQSAQSQHIDLPAEANRQFIAVYAQSVGQNSVSEWSLPAITRLPMHLAASDMPYKIDWENEETDTWQERMLFPYGSQGTTNKFPNEIITLTQYAPNYYGQNQSYAGLLSGTASQEGNSKGHYVWLRKEYNEVTKGDPALYGFNHKYGNYIALPEVDDVSQVLVKFYMQRYSSTVEGSSRVAVGVMTDPYDITTFETVATFEATSNTEYQPFSCSFESYKGKGKVIAIQAIDATNPASAGSSSSSSYAWNNWYSSVQRLDWINMFTLGTCNPIANPQVEASHDAALISWGANGMTEWQIRVLDSKGDTLVSQNIDTTFFKVEGLEPHSNYKYMVSPLCDADYELSDWLTFTTECLPGEALPFVEDFESTDYTTGSSKYWIPYCWTSPVYSYSYSSEPPSYYPYISRSTLDTWAHNSKTMFALYTASSSTVQNQMWVALPRMAAAIDSLQLEMYVRGYSISQNSMLQVGVMTDPSDISTFEIVDSINVAGTAWKGTIVKFNSYKGEGKYIAIKRNYERDGAVNFYLDDIIVDYIKDCEKVFTVNTSAPTINGATFAWNSVKADKYEVLVTNKSINTATEDTTGLVVELFETDKTEVEYRNGNLALNTNYYVYVRSVCGTEKTSWSDEAAFKTTCLPQTAEQYGVFDFTDVNSLGCWTVGVLNGTTKEPSRSGSVTGKFGFYLYLFNTAASDGAYAIMPPLDVQDITKYQVKFDILSNSTLATNLKRMTVGIISNAADLSTFVPLTTVSFPYATDSTGGISVTLPLSNYDGDYVTGAMGNQIMFLSESGDSTNYAQIDNIRFELIPDCAYPTAVSIDSTGTFGAKFSWNNTGSEYQVAITSTKAAPDMDNAEVVKIVNSIKDTTATVDGLEMLTEYFVHVRTICGSGDTSAWSDARSFNTTCPDSYTLPFAEDFESFTTTSGNRKPDCWTCYYLNGETVTEGTNASYPSFGTTAANAHEGTRSLYMYSSGATTKTFSYAALPLIDADLSKTMISFWYKANTAGTSTGPNRKVVVGIADEVSTLDTLIATFSPIDTVITEVASYEKYSRIVSEKYSGNGKYIVFIGIDGNGGTSSGGVYIDDIEISLVPTCFMPDNLSAKMYDTEAVLSWEQLQGDNTAWDVAFGPEGSDVANMSVVSANTDSEFVVSNLQPSTSYDFYVRANCGSGDVSDWRGPVTASTLYQVALADANWTFENGEPTKPNVPGQTYKAPGEWFVNNFVSGTGTAGNVPYIQANSFNSTTGILSSRYALSGDSALRLYGSGSYVALPVVANEDYDSLEVHLFARSLYSNTHRGADMLGQDSVFSTTYSYNYASYKRTVRVGVATDPYDMSTFEELTAYILPQVGTSTSTKAADAVDPENNSWWREIVVPLYGAKGKYIIFASPEAANVVYIDNVSVQKADPNVCAKITKLAINEGSLTYNAAEFSWLSPKDKFKVSIVETETGTNVLTDQVVDTTFFAATNLNEQTAYTISVQALCDNDAQSDVVTLDFTTPCTPFDLNNGHWNFADNLYQWGTSATYVMPSCWSQGLGNGSSASYTPYAVVNSSTYSYGRQIYADEEQTEFDRALRFYTTTSYYNAYAVLPEAGIELDSMTLHFWGRAAYFYSPTYTTAANRGRLYSANGNYSRTLVVGVIEDPEDFATFTPIDTVFYNYEWTSTTGIFSQDDETGNEYWQEYALPLAKYAGKGRIAFVAPQPTATSYFFVDDVEIIRGDFCIPVTGIRTSDITSSSATISWASFVDSANVALEVATDNSFADSTLVASQMINGETSVVVSDLQPATRYFFRLKHICDAELGDESNWSATNEFTTNYVIRFSQNFNSVNTTIPAGWSRSLSASVDDVFSGAKVLTEASATASYAWRTNTGSDIQIYTNTTTNNASSSTSSQYQWLLTPAIDLAADSADKLMLSFDVALRASSSTADNIVVPNPNTGLVEKFMVIISTDGGQTWSADNAFTWSTEGDGDFDYADLYSRGVLKTKYLDITKYAGKSVKIAFYSGSFAPKETAGSKNIILLDNIQLNAYVSQSFEAQVCRWEDYSNELFNIDADELEVGENFFFDFQPATRDGQDDILNELTVNVATDATTVLDDVVLCQGEQFQLYNFNFEANESGVYKQKLQNAAGCDSIVILNVTVNPRLYNDAVATICQGSFYEFNGVRYYTSTEKVDTIASLVTGCDSIVTLHLTVNEILREDEGQVYVCEGDSFNFTDKYSAITVEGIYVDTVQNEQGCDVVKTIEVKQAFNAHVDIRAAICEGEVYNEGVFSGLSQAGIYTTPSGTLKTEHGCDSTITLTLLVAKDGVINDTISHDNLPYVLNGEELFGADTENGIYTKTVNLGCGDVTLVLNIGAVDGLNNAYANTVAIAPNPAKVGEPVRVLSQFNASQLENMVINVYSATGMLVSRQRPQVGNVVISPIETTGVYMVVINSGNQTWQSKLIVE